MTSGGRAMRADARRNYERLIAAGRDAFVECGPEVPMDLIAKRAQVGPGTLYRHFPTREVLLAAVYREDVDNLAEQAAQFARQYPPERALAEWIRVQLDFVRLKRGLGGALKAMLGADSETATWCRDTMRAALQSLLTEAQRVGAVRTDVEAANVLRLIHGIGVAAESAPEEADRMLAIVLDGLRPQPPRPEPPADREPGGGEPSGGELGGGESAG